MTKLKKILTVFGIILLIVALLSCVFGAIVVLNVNI